MQEQDAVTNAFVEANDRFADIFNGGIYDGCQVLNPSKLKKMDRTSGTLLHTSGEEKVNEAVTKYRDVVFYRMRWIRSPYRNMWQIMRKNFVI